MHVTLRARDGLPPLRLPAVFPAVRRALAAVSTAHFRLTHFSIQRDHLHLVVEAEDSTRLTRGLQGLAIRVARAVNRVLDRRGKVWADRFHARLLRTPREVRLAIVYVLNNVRKHIAGARGVDPCSSAPWFAEWGTGGRVPAEPSPVVAAQTWLGRVGWRRHGPIHLDDSPRRKTVSKT